MIPDAAVEAAARAMAPAVWGPSVWQFAAHGESPTDARNRVQKQALQDARAALEAAAPHMLTRVTNAVINRAFEDGQASALARLADAYDEGLEAGDGLRPRGNPYI